MHLTRFYIMHLEDRPLKISTVTHHASVTQCLGSIGGHVWYLGVAKPSILDPIEIKGTVGADVVQSHCGHFYVPPAVDDVRVFRISGPKFLKLNRGTWHAGPLFLEKTMDFYNLELSNTNVSYFLFFAFIGMYFYPFACDGRCKDMHTLLFLLGLKRKE